jgi:hypothetical protein
MPAFYLIGTALMAIISIIFLPKTTKEENTSSRCRNWKTSFAENGK